jgi:amidophosphoribosyltransferase
MAVAIGADSLRYLPVDAIARCLEKPSSMLCQACIEAKYPTAAGGRLYQIALDNARGESDSASGRTYDAPVASAAH